MSVDPKLFKKLNALAPLAIETWGREAQLDMVIEEALEVALEMHRRRRNRHDEQKMLEESVDMFIMGVEMGHHFGWDRFNEMLQNKLYKFAGNLYRSTGDETILWRYDNEEDSSTDESGTTD